MQIVSIPNSECRLMDTNNIPFKKIIQDKLTTEFIELNMRLLPTGHSKNQYLKEMAAADTSNGYVAIANEHTCGRAGETGYFYHLITGRQVLVTAVNHSNIATITGIDKTGALIVTGDCEEIQYYNW